MLLVSYDLEKMSYLSSLIFGYQFDGMVKFIRKTMTILSNIHFLFGGSFYVIGEIILYLRFYLLFSSLPNTLLHRYCYILLL